jgi:hypothetical protein
MKKVLLTTVAVAVTAAHDDIPKNRCFRAASGWRRSPRARDALREALAIAEALGRYGKLTAAQNAESRSRDAHPAIAIWCDCSPRRFLSLLLVKPVKVRLYGIGVIIVS